jgi:hypothetical protein
MDSLLTRLIEALSQIPQEILVKKSDCLVITPGMRGEE